MKGCSLLVVIVNQYSAFPNASIPDTNPNKHGSLSFSIICLFTRKHTISSSCFIDYQPICNAYDYMRGYHVCWLGIFDEANPVDHWMFSPAASPLSNAVLVICGKADTCSISRVTNKWWRLVVIWLLTIVKKVFKRCRMVNAWCSYYTLDATTCFIYCKNHHPPGCMFVMEDVYTRNWNFTRVHNFIYYTDGMIIYWGYI